MLRPQSVVLAGPGKGEQKRRRVGGEMLVVAVGNDDIALDQRIVEPYAAGRRGTHRSSAIFGGANSSGGHGSVGGVGALDVGKSMPRRQHPGLPD